MTIEQRAATTAGELAIERVCQGIRSRATHLDPHSLADIENSLETFKNEALKLLQEIPVTQWQTMLLLLLNKANQLLLHGVLTPAQVTILETVLWSLITASVKADSVPPPAAPPVAAAKEVESPPAQASRKRIKQDEPDDES